MSDYFTEQAEYREKRAQITEEAYLDLIELVGKLGSRKLKDEMWKLVTSAREKTDAAHAASRNWRTTAGGVR